MNRWTNPQLPPSIHDDCRGRREIKEGREAQRNLVFSFLPSIPGTSLLRLSPSRYLFLSYHPPINSV